MPYLLIIAHGRPRGQCLLFSWFRILAEKQVKVFTNIKNFAEENILIFPMVTKNRNLQLCIVSFLVKGLNPDTTH